MWLRMLRLAQAQAGSDVPAARVRPVQYRPRAVDAGPAGLPARTGLQAQQGACTRRCKDRSERADTIARVTLHADGPHEVGRILGGWRLPGAHSYEEPAALLGYRRTQGCPRFQGRCCYGSEVIIAADALEKPRRDRALRSESWSPGKVRLRGHRP